METKTVRTMLVQHARIDERRFRNAAEDSLRRLISDAERALRDLEAGEHFSTVGGSVLNHQHFMDAERNLVRWWDSRCGLRHRRRRNGGGVSAVLEQSPDELDFLVGATIESVRVNREEYKFGEFTDVHEAIELQVRFARPFNVEGTQCRTGTIEILQDPEGNGPGFLALTDATP
jgi:hypothetical protein